MIQAKNTLDAVTMLVAAFHGKPVSEQTIRVYVAALDDLEPVLLAKACLALIRERQWPSLPQVGEIRAKYHELENPHALTAEAAWEHLQAWGRSGERSESELDSSVLFVCKTFGSNGAWTLTDPAVDMRQRGHERAAFLRAWNDRAERRQRVERAEDLGALEGGALRMLEGGGHAS